MRSKADILLAAFVIVAVIYSVAWFAFYRSLKSGGFSGRENSNPTPIDITTPEERAPRETTFAFLKERTIGVTTADSLRPSHLDMLLS
jgi:hypothetical protein